MTERRGLPSDVVKNRDMPVDSMPTMHTTGFDYKLAHVLSYVFHPIITSALTFVVVGLFGDIPRLNGMMWAIGITLFQVVPSATFYLIRLRQGVYTDREVSVRHQRHELYLFAMIVMLTGVGILFLIDAPRQFIALLICGAALGMVGGLINLFWKISMHTGVIAICAATSVIYAPKLGVLLWACVLAVGWARVRTRNHTLMQVIAGLCVASIIVVMVSLAFGII